MRAPMSFFDTTPSGRILNRFSKDLDMIDFQIPMVLRGFVTMFFQLVAVYVVIIYSRPLMAAVAIPVLLVFFFMLVFYLPASRQLRRLEFTTHSPVFSHVAETLQGAFISVARQGVENGNIFRNKKN